jgi:hypothetical protein
MNDFYQDTNPMVVSPTQEISINPKEHPFFRLDHHTRILILYWVMQWSVSEFAPIKEKIDAEMKSKGRSSPYCVISGNLGDATCWC